jgi:replicative DNA helicase
MSRYLGGFQQQALERSKNPRAIIGFPSAITKMSYTLRGYQRKRVYIVAARPGMGKTTYLLTEMTNMAAHGNKVALVSLEMSEDQVLTCIISSVSSIPAVDIETGLKPHQIAPFNKTIDMIAKWPMFINPVQRMDSKIITEVTGDLKPDALFIDYIQLVKSGESKRSRAEEVSSIAYTMKELSLTQNIAVIAAAQFNRDNDKSLSKVTSRTVTRLRPKLHQLKESGGLEEASDVVLAIFREGYYLQEPENDDPDAIFSGELLVLKNRGGPSNRIIDVDIQFAYKRFIDPPKPGKYNLNDEKDVAEAHKLVKAGGTVLNPFSNGQKELSE